MVENGKLYNRIYKERNGKMASSNLKDNLEKLQIVAKERTVKTQNISINGKFNSKYSYSDSVFVTRC